MTRDPATIATAGEGSPSALATPGGGPSPAEPPRACPDCGASTGNPQGDGWQCGVCSASNPVCAGCSKVVRVTVRRLCVPCHKEADRLVLRVLNRGDATTTDQRARQDASATSPAGAPSPAEGDGRSGPEAAGAVPLPPAVPVGANARGVALQLVRCWALQQHLADPAQADAPVDGLHGALLHQVLAATDRFSRAAKRVGWCAIVIGCGRVHEDADQAARDPAQLYFPLHLALMELTATWKTSTPTSCAEAAADLAALLRQHAALHREAARALCAACRPAFLAHLEAQP